MTSQKRTWIAKIGRTLFHSFISLSVSQLGAGGVHYDEALGMADLGDDQGPPPTLALRQWHFVQ